MPGGGCTFRSGAAYNELARQGIALRVAIRRIVPPRHGREFLNTGRRTMQKNFRLSDPVRPRPDAASGRMVPDSSESDSSGPARAVVPRRAGQALLIAVACAFLPAGCGEKPGIVTYTVPKRPPAVLRQTQTAPRGPESSPRSSVRYDTPEGWRPGRGTAFSVAAFEVGEGERKGEITLSPAMGAIDANVNRWRGQVGLDPQSSAEIAKALEPVPVGDSRGLYVELFGPEREGKRPAILGIIAEAGGRQWFFKFTGDEELARQEKGRFLEFAKSMRFEGAGDGD